MRKIISEEEKEKKKKKRTLILSIVMLFIMVVSTAGFAIMSREDLGSQSEQNFSKESIREIGGRWEVISEGKIFILHSSPEEVKNVSVEITTDINTYKNKIVYISSENKAIYSEIYSALSLFASRVQAACYGPCEENLPEKNCTEDYLFVWKDSLTNKVYQEGKCIFIEGDLRAADAAIYKLLGF